MERPKLKILLELIEKELEKAKRQAEQTHLSAIEIGRAAAASPSQSGDREHARNQALLTKENLERIELLYREVDNSLDESPVIVKPVCNVLVEYEDKARYDFYLVNQPVFLGDVKLVSLNSPLGRAISGKKIGNEFEVTVGSGPSRKGTVLHLE